MMDPSIFVVIVSSLGPSIAPIGRAIRSSILAIAASNAVGETTILLGAARAMYADGLWSKVSFAGNTAVLRTSALT